MKKITLIILGAAIVAIAPVLMLGMKAIPQNDTPDTSSGVIELLPNGQIKLLPGSFVVGKGQLASGKYILPFESNSALANEYFIVKRGELRISVTVGAEFDLQNGDEISVGRALRYVVLAPAPRICPNCGTEMPPDPAPLPENPMARPLGPAALCPKCGN